MVLPVFKRKEKQITFCLGSLNISCPFMNVVQPLLDDAEWNVDAILNSLSCATCLDQAYNHWLICPRKTSEINLHPEYCSRMRQTWFVAMLPIKYLILPETYIGPTFDFGGMFQPRLRDYISSDPTLPRDAKKIEFISYGKYFIISKS